MISAKTPQSAPVTLLIRFGAIPEVARFVAVSGGDAWERGQRVVVETHRGREIGTVLEKTRETADESEGPMTVLRLATDDDLRIHDELVQAGRREFDDWNDRIADWKLDLELIDLEWMFDRSKLVLYVLNDRGGECTKLALYAAAGGFATVEVQPVNTDGLVQLPPSGGGCGSGGGGCGSCGTD